jgi:predicted ATPase/class 3 adenylate cyclase
MPELPSGTVTFLFSDIEGSTRLLQRLSSDYARVLGEHQALLRAAWATHGGVEVDTQGDSFFVTFPSAPQAVAAAAQVTHALADHPWPEGASVRVRIGLHTGTPALAGNNYIGLDVHRAARIAASGHGGQVLLSAATRALAEPELPADTILRDLGEFRLKDLQRPEHVFQLVLDGLPSDFPPLKTLDRTHHNLPIQPTPLLGRAREIDDLTILLRRDDVRLVTLTGPGGTGKTRLGQQVAAELAEAFQDGVWFVRLSRLVDPNLVLPTIAQALGLQDLGSRPLEEVLREHLRDRHVLLLLDNFEQLTASVPQVGTLLEASAQLKLLVTSRVPLHLRGEKEYPVAPLALPPALAQPPSTARSQPTPPKPQPSPTRPTGQDAVERLTQYAAVTLFIQRALDVKPDFAVTNVNAPAVAEICARLDGLPLAIELAAARIKLLPPQQLLKRLERRLPLLTGGAQDLETRQQTMRATLAWSEGLLSPEERILFRRLAVFMGGCTLEAAEVICAAPEGAEPLASDLLDGLGQLVDQSLVQQREEDEEARFGLLQVVREYALEKLEASGEGEALRHAHAAYYLHLAEESVPQLTRKDQHTWLQRLESEHDNLRAALGWGLEQGAAETFGRLCAALAPFWETRGHWNEKQQWLGRALSLGEALPVRQRAQLLREAGHVAVLQSDYAAAATWLEESLALFRSMDERVGAGWVLKDLAALAHIEEQFERAEHLYEEGLALLQEASDRKHMSDLLQGQASLSEARGKYPAARNLFERALALALSLGDTHDIAACRAGLGRLALMEGDLVAAEKLLQGAFAMQEQLNDTNCSAISLRDLGLLALERGDAATAQELFGESLSRFQEIGKRRGIAEALAGLGAARIIAGDLQGADEVNAESLRIEHLLANRRRTAACLDGLAEVALARGQPERAARLQGAAAQVLSELPATPLLPSLAARREQVTLNARQLLGEEAWSAAYASGQALSREEAIAEALGERGEGVDA